MKVEPLEEKYRSFGWDVRRIDGHDMEQVVDALELACTQHGRLIVQLPNTVKARA
jgi:transketolase